MKIATAYGTTRPGRTVKALAATLISLTFIVVAVTFAWPAPEQKSGQWPPPMSAEEMDLQRRVNEIAKDLKAPCCPNLTVAQHDSPTTLAIKREMHDMLKEGKSRAEIIAALKAKYGDSIVAAPAIAPWLLYTILGSIAGLGVILLVSWWMLRHESEPHHLDEGHWMEEGATGTEKAPGAEGETGVKKAS